MVVDYKKCKMEVYVYLLWIKFCSVIFHTKRSASVCFRWVLCLLQFANKNFIKGQHFNQNKCQINPTFLSGGLLSGGWTTPEVFLVLLEVILS